MDKEIEALEPNWRSTGKLSGNDAAVINGKIRLV
jgi:hypothetical protein